MPPGTAPLSMKIIPLRWKGAGVGCPQPEDPPRRLRPSAPPRRGFSWELPMSLGGGTAGHENIGLVLVVAVVLGWRIRVR